MQIDEISVQTMPVKSSNVAAIGFSSEYGILAVEMINGSLYYYLDVPKIIYDQLLSSPAIGSYMWRNVKGKYRYVRIK